MSVQIAVPELILRRARTMSPDPSAFAERTKHSRGQLLSFDRQLPRHSVDPFFARTNSEQNDPLFPTKDTSVPPSDTYGIDIQGLDAKCAWVIEDATLAATAIKATVDLRQFETKMGFLAPYDSQKLCTKWGAKLSQRGHDAAAIDHIAKGTKVPVKTTLQADRDAAAGEHITCDPMGDLFQQTKAGNRALHGVAMHHGYIGCVGRVGEGAVGVDLFWDQTASNFHSFYEPFNAHGVRRLLDCMYETCL